MTKNIIVEIPQSLADRVRALVQRRGDGLVWIEETSEAQVIAKSEQHTCKAKDLIQEGRGASAMTSSDHPFSHLISVNFKKSASVTDFVEELDSLESFF